MDGPNNKVLGIEGLAAAVKTRLDLPTETILEEIVAEARSFSATRQFNDDVCLVGIDVRGPISS